MKPHVHVDFETRSAADLRAIGADVYADDPTTDILCMGWAVGDEPVQMWKMGEAHPRKLFELIASGAEIYAHNAPFELALWNRCATKKYGWPALPVRQTRCTSVMAYAMGLPGSLEKAAAAAGITQQKDMLGSRIMMKLCKPKELLPCPDCLGSGQRKKALREAIICEVCEGLGNTAVWHTDADDYEKLYAYCAQDVEVERELSKRLLPLSPQEQALWILDQTINQRGIAVDLKSAEAAVKIVELEAIRLREEIQKVTNNFLGTPNENVRFVKWLEEQGVKADGIAKGDVTELLARNDIPDNVRAALLIRREAARTSTKKLAAMMSRTGDDGRLRAIVQFYGAGTGRWAGRGVQVHNFPRPTIEQEEIEDVFKILEKVEA